LLQIFQKRVAVQEKYGMDRAINRTKDKITTLKDEMNGGSVKGRVYKMKAYARESRQWT